MSTNVARGTILGFVGQAWHLVASFVLYAFLTRNMGPDLFGQWRVILSVLGWFEIFVHSGIVSVATKVMAEKPDDVPVLIRATYLGQMIIVAVITVLMVVFAGIIAGLLSDPALATYIRISALDIPFYALFMAALAHLLGKQRFERQVVALAVYSAAKLVAIGILVAVGFSVAGALIGNACASLIGFAVAFLPLPGTRAPFRDLFSDVRWMSVAAVPFISLSLIEGIGYSADLWLVSAVVVSSTAVGWYASANALAEVPVFLFLGLMRVLFPSIARSLAENDIPLSSRYAIQAVRLGVIVTVLIVGLVAGGGRQILEFLYSAQFVGAYGPLVVLMIAAVGHVTRSSCTKVLLVQDRRMRANMILVAALVMEFALLVTVPRLFGVVGAAAAAAIAALFGGAWAAFEIRGLLGVRPLLTLGRCIVGASVVGVALAQLPFPPWAVLVMLPLGAVVYFAILGALREFDREDYVSVRTALGR